MDPASGTRTAPAPRACWTCPGRRHRKNLRIPAIRTGTYGHLRRPELPVDIRRAVEGQRHGWERLPRFQQTVAHHSINVAAHQLGYHSQNLNLQIQRLEHDIGAQLLHRGHRYQPILPTARGSRLLGLLNRADIRQLLDQNTPTGKRHRSEKNRAPEP